MTELLRTSDPAARAEVLANPLRYLGAAELPTARTADPRLGKRANEVRESLLLTGSASERCAHGGAVRAGGLGRRRRTNPGAARRAHASLGVRGGRGDRSAGEGQRAVMNEARRLLNYEVVRRSLRGESMRAIARAMGLAPRTVKKILAREELRRTEGESALERELPARRTSRASKLDVFDERIAAWLERYPDLTATRLLENLTREGFDGGYTIVRQHLNAWRAEHAAPKRADERVETPPGHQAQFDWSPFKLEDGTVENVWSCTLAWSRGRSFFADDNQRQPTILRRLVHSFTQLGGVPGECVTDTMSGVVDGWEANQPILNIRFVDFAAYYRFAVHVSPRRHPKYKGKVERPFRYVDENFCNGRTFRTREEFREGLAWWRDTHAMQRPHPLTKRPIAEMLDEERPYLQALPRVPSAS